ncbi:hypothetical protein D3C84_803440 [compost metagenome]
MQAQASVISAQTFSGHGARAIDGVAVPQARQGGHGLEAVVPAHGAAAEELAALIAEQPHAGQTQAQAFGQGFDGRFAADQPWCYGLWLYLDWRVGVAIDRCHLLLRLRKCGAIATEFFAVGLPLQAFPFAGWLQGQLIYRRLAITGSRNSEQVQ